MADLTNGRRIPPGYISNQKWQVNNYLHTFLHTHLYSLI